MKIPSHRGNSPAKWSRRRVLQSLGVSTAALPFVPLLEGAAGGPESPPKRFLVFYHPHGVVRDNWLPTGGETNFVLPTILAPLEPYREQLLVVDGLRVLVSGPAGGPHTVGPAYVFTASPMLEGNDFQHPDSGGPHGWNSHPSIDQAIATVIGNDTPFRSLEFGVQSGGSHPGSRIAYAGPAQPLAPEGDPFVMFDRVFGDSGVDLETAARLKAERLGVIDVIKPELDTLVGKVAQNDRLKIEAHLAAIEQMEQQFGATYTCMPPDLGAPVDLNDFGVTDVISRQQLDLVVEAFACGVTNVASIMYRRGENDGFPYPFLGIPDEHHLKTHAGDSDLATWNQVTAIQRWYCEQLAYLASKMATILEPDGSTLLDNTVILWGSEIGKGNNHAFDNMPFVLLGSGGGALDTGRFVQAPGQNHCRLFVSLCQAFGHDVNVFGGFDDGTGALPGILA